MDSMKYITFFGRQAEGSLASYLGNANELLICGNYIINMHNANYYLRK